MTFLLGLKGQLKVINQNKKYTSIQPTTVPPTVYAEISKAELKNVLIMF